MTNCLWLTTYDPIVEQAIDVIRDSLEGRLQHGNFQFTLIFFVINITDKEKDGCLNTAKNDC